MLVQSFFCRGWHRQIIQPATSLLSSRSNAVLHQTRTNIKFSTRFLRNSARRQNPPGTPLVEPNPFESYAVGIGGPVPVSNIWKALIFTGSFIAGSFISATVLEYENARNLLLERARKAKFPWLRKQSSDTGYWNNLKSEVLYAWDRLSTGEKVFVPLCALNLIVFGLWRVPALKNTMLTYFCSNPAARVVCWPMFLSTFSHYSMFHIFANMYVLHSFSNAAVLSLGKEQFLAVYLSAGVMASMGSILYKAITSQAGLSLGASGAIMAILAYVCTQYPDTQLSILFIPMVTFSAGSAIKVIMGIDFAGCIMGWKFFDHAAHLSGALFGIFWTYFGTQVWHHRIRILSVYHDWRKAK